MIRNISFGIIATPLGLGHPVLVNESGFQNHIFDASSHEGVVRDISQYGAAWTPNLVVAGDGCFDGTERFT